MTSKIYDGGPAFPSPALIDPETGQAIEPPMDGMSLRAWLAGKALQGLLANCYKEATETKPETFVGSAVDLADMMIARLEAGNE